jgi:protein SCO1/2
MRKIVVRYREFTLTLCIDPEGDFVEAIGRNFTADQAAKIMVDHIKDWEKPLKKEQRWS